MNLGFRLDGITDYLGSAEGLAIDGQFPVFVLVNSYGSKKYF